MYDNLGVAAEELSSVNRFSLQIIGKLSKNYNSTIVDLCWRNPKPDGERLIFFGSQPRPTHSQARWFFLYIFFHVFICLLPSIKWPSENPTKQQQRTNSFNLFGKLQCWRAQKKMHLYHGRNRLKANIHTFIVRIHATIRNKCTCGVILWLSGCREYSKRSGPDHYEL